ncbi:MAG: type II secretion system F family protein [Alphaproteobacteria bacterium]|nr:type II secretion system F family protein [Alphaproteobacteria bacterium]
MVELLTSTSFWTVVLASTAAFATVVSLFAPLLKGDRLGARLKLVANRREELRQRQRESFKKAKGGIRSRTPAGFMKETVEKLNLETLLSAESMKLKLIQAGFRGQGPIVTMMFARVTMPFVFLALASIYLYGINDHGFTSTSKLSAVLLAGIIGFYAPDFFVANLVKRRQESVQRSFPDALDLLLICVEAGMSVEAAFNRVGKEVGSSSVELAEELGLTTAELSYLQDRRQAYENLGIRTGLPGVKAVCTSLIQAERYGTPLGKALRVMAAENRALRMAAAEKKAAALPAMLTVPMIVFFLPALFMVILGPAYIRYTATPGAF